MKRHWTWVILLITLLLVVACRTPAEIEETVPESAATEQVDLGLCPPDEECDDETVDAETEEQTSAEVETPASPTSEPTAQPTTPGEAENEPDDIPVDDPLVVKDTDWVIGPADATLTLIEYADYL